MVAEAEGIGLPTAQPSPQHFSPPPAALAATPPKPHLKLQSLKIQVWNVMGTTTITHELSEHLAKHKPDVMILTETKMTTNTQESRAVKDVFRGEYELHCSSVDAPKQFSSAKRY